MRQSMLVFLFLAWSAAAVAAAGVPRVDAPCSGCRAMAFLLQDRVDDEPVRNHLDMRHRLDAQGNREGKVIDYKVSELRAIELLDDLCPSLNDWTLVKVNSTHGQTVHWERIFMASQPARFPEQEETLKQKKLRAFCGWIVEEHEEVLTDAIRSGKMRKGGNLVPFICEELVGACPIKPPASGERREKDTWPETSDGTTSFNSVNQAQSEAMAMAAMKEDAGGSEAGGQQPPPLSDEL